VFMSEAELQLGGATACVGHADGSEQLQRVKMCPGLPTELGRGFSWTRHKHQALMHAQPLAANIGATL
jgi:hypothetical protein